MEEEIYHIKRAKKNINDFDYLYRKYFPKINNFIYHRVFDDSQRQEIVSNIFFKAMKKLNMFTFWESDKSLFSAWLYRIAINEMNQYFRNQKRERKIQENVKWNFIVKTPEEFSEKKEINYELIQEKIKELSNEEQNLITLRFFEKLKYKEIAQIYHKKENTIKVRMHRILKKLRQSLQGGNCA